VPETDTAVSRSQACEQLALLAEHELHLVRTDAVEELEGVHDRRVALLAALEAPGAGPLGQADKDVLQRATRTQLLAAEAMRQRRDRLAAQLSQNGVARRAAAGYAASASF
jgi:hypothetical protein